LSQLSVDQIDSPRLQLHIRGGKGDKDRYLTLPQRLLCAFAQPLADPSSSCLALSRIAISGSATLIQSLLPLRLIDELNLLVYPVVLGRGKRLFDGVAVLWNITDWIWPFLLHKWRGGQRRSDP
jgi:riboflavin biosynthesis pyrimidine reductase